MDQPQRRSSNQSARPPLPDVPKDIAGRSATVLSPPPKFRPKANRQPQQPPAVRRPQEAQPPPPLWPEKVLVRSPSPKHALVESPSFHPTVSYITVVVQIPTRPRVLRVRIHGDIATLELGELRLAISHATGIPPSYQHLVKEDEVLPKLDRTECGRFGITAGTVLFLDLDGPVAADEIACDLFVPQLALTSRQENGDVSALRRSVDRALQFLQTVPSGGTSP
jgi:hypothetical protein